MRWGYMLLFTIVTDETQLDEPPDIEEIRQGVWDGLPKEWQDDGYDGYALVAIDSMGELTR